MAPFRSWNLYPFHRFGLFPDELEEDVSRSRNKSVVCIYSLRGPQHPSAPIVAWALEQATCPLCERLETDESWPSILRAACEGEGGECDSSLAGWDTGDS